MRHRAERHRHEVADQVSATVPFASPGRRSTLALGTQIKIIATKDPLEYQAPPTELIQLAQTYYDRRWYTVMYTIFATLSLVASATAVGAETFTYIVAGVGVLFLALCIAGVVVSFRAKAWIKSK